VTFWVEHLPAHVHLLLSSRVDPDLPLSRWRARGQLLEIRTDDLRFRPDEASLFLRQAMRLALSEEQEIADALVIELSTVKKHVSNLLGKLGVASRTQAIAQARARLLL
jgi:LuxR family maltose regulon positive regulatory protein